MEETEPQTSEKATGIFADNAADRSVSVLLPGFVAPHKRVDQPKRSLRRWLEARLNEECGACNGLADKLLLGRIPGEKHPLPVTGVNLRAFCEQAKLEVVRKFFFDLDVDKATAERIRVGSDKKASTGSHPMSQPARKRTRPAREDDEDAAPSKMTCTVGADGTSAAAACPATGAQLSLPCT